MHDDPLFKYHKEPEKKKYYALRISSPCGTKVDIIKETYSYVKRKAADLMVGDVQSIEIQELLEDTMTWNKVMYMQVNMGF